MKSYTLTFNKPVTAAGCYDPTVSAAIHRAIKTQRQLILRRVARTPPSSLSQRKKVEEELQLLDDVETQWFGIRHRTTALPLGKDGKRCVPKTARGKRHVPLPALPLNAKNRRYVPSAREIVETAIFQKFADKGNLPMALAKLAAINPGKHKAMVQKEAMINRRVRRAMNRVGSDIAIPVWPVAPDEMLVLENFYATERFRRPLLGMAYDQAVWMLNEDEGAERQITVDRYRRILRKYLLSKKE